MHRNDFEMLIPTEHFLQLADQNAKRRPRRSAHAGPGHADGRMAREDFQKGSLTSLRQRFVAVIENLEKNSH
jgi:hypothetical protein